MRTGRNIVALAVVLALPSSIALAQSTTPSGTQTTTSAQTTTQSSTTPSASTQNAFDKLSPGGQKIALALCGAQAGGCPTGQSSTQPPSGSTQTTVSSAKTQSLTLDQIAQMKQHRGWAEIFKDMQKSGQIPPDVKNLGQLVSGRYQSSGTTITTGSGKTEVVGGSGNSGNSGSQLGKGHAGDDSAGSSAGGAGSSAGSQAAASSHGGGRGK